MFSVMRLCVFIQEQGVKVETEIDVYIDVKQAVTWHVFRHVTEGDNVAYWKTNGKINNDLVTEYNKNK